MTTLLVVGTAPSMIDDYIEAQRLRPDHRAMAVNKAADLVRAHYLATMHPEKMHNFVAMQKAKFWDRFTTHAAKPIREKKRLQHYPAVQYWHKDAQCGATSGWAAVLIGKILGYTEIIMCGCPISGGDGYHIAVEDKRNEFFWLNPPGSSAIGSYQEALRREARLRGEGVYSMSGYTRKILGGPPDVIKN